jgi:hypothetical protein
MAWIIRGIVLKKGTPELLKKQAFPNDYYLFAIKLKKSVFVEGYILTVFR